MTVGATVWVSCVLSGLSIGIRWWRFLQTVPLDIRWECSLTTVPGTFASVTHTCSPGGRLLSSCARRHLLKRFWSTLLLSFSFQMTTVLFGSDGSSRDGSLGTVERSWRPINSWAGLKPLWSGMARYASLIPFNRRPSCTVRKVHSAQYSFNVHSHELNSGHSSWPFSWPWSTHCLLWDAVSDCPCRKHLSVRFP